MEGIGEIIRGATPVFRLVMPGTSTTRPGIIADAARTDGGGDYRRCTIGMGELVRYRLGTIPET
jgi:hypothetical protein